jgi:Crinkler effector protein N-terminal domain
MYTAVPFQVETTELIINFPFLTIVTLAIVNCPMSRVAGAEISSTSQTNSRMSDSDILKINCWVLGDRYNRAFQVKIPRNESVDALRVAIKAKKPNAMKDIDAHSLILYKVSIPFSPELAQDVARLGLDGLGLDNPFSKLSVAFDNELLDGYVHVVVKISGVWTSNYLSTLHLHVSQLHGCHLVSVSSFTLSRVDSFFHFSRAYTFSYSDIVEPVAEDNRGIKQKRSEIFGHDSKPCRYCRLSSYDVVFIAREAAIIAARNAPPLSETSKSTSVYLDNQDASPVYNGRPTPNTGPSIGLYCKAFAEAIDALSDISKVEPSQEQLARTGEFLLHAAPIYKKEERRVDVTFQRLERFFNVKIKNELATENRDARVDGGTYVSLRTGERAVAIFYEVKGELDSGDPGLLAALTYRKHVVQSCVRGFCLPEVFLSDIPPEQYDNIRNVSCCPSLIVAIAGPYICFLGCVFSHVPVVQHLTDYIYLGGDPFSRYHVTHVARVFHTIAKAIDSLIEEYGTMIGAVAPKPSSFLPYSTFGVANLVYHDRLRGASDVEDDPRQTLFRATLGKTNVVVKFCETYCEDAHRLLADHRFAPTLHHCGKVSGGLWMVVMDWEPSGNAAYCFRHQLKLPDEVLKDVRDAVTILHNKGFVFGDLRWPNIVVVERKTGANDQRTIRGMLIDFDWAGKDGEVTYPHTINLLDIWWPHGVRGGRLIAKSHDLEMLGNL